MPLGQTILHFPHNMHDETIFSASRSLPLWRLWSNFLTLIPVNSPAGHVALHDPHDMQRLASGSSAHSLSNKVLSTLSISMAELADNLNPNMFIISP